MACISVTSLILVTLQSCSSIPVYSRPDGNYVKIDDIKAPFLLYGVYGVYGFILLVGCLFCILTWYQVKKISKQLERLGYSI